MPQACVNGLDCVDRSEWCRRLDESDSTHSSFKAVLSLLDHSCVTLEVTSPAWPLLLLALIVRVIMIPIPHPIFAHISGTSICILPADFYDELAHPAVILPVVVREHRELPVPAFSLLLLPVKWIVLLNSHSSCRSEKGNDCFDHSGRLVV